VAGIYYFWWGIRKEKYVVLLLQETLKNVNEDKSLG
jgi:hypothetical protein